MLATKTLLAGLAAIASSLARASSRCVSSRVCSARCRSRDVARDDEAADDVAGVVVHRRLHRFDADRLPSLRTMFHSSGLCARPAALGGDALGEPLVVVRREQTRRGHARPAPRAG